jgi:hypothetical protein
MARTAALPWMGSMGEISEKTRVTLNIVGALMIVALVFGVGRFWGDRGATDNFRDQTLARHEAEITELRRSIGEIQASLREIKTAQDTSRESTATAVRNTTFLIEKLGQVQVALAGRGIIVTGD